MNQIKIDDTVIVLPGSCPTDLYNLRDMVCVNPYIREAKVLALDIGDANNFDILLEYTDVTGNRRNYWFSLNALDIGGSQMEAEFTLEEIEIAGKIVEGK